MGGDDASKVPRGLVCPVPGGGRGAVGEDDTSEVPGGLVRPVTDERPDDTTTEGSGKVQVGATSKGDTGVMEVK